MAAPTDRSKRDGLILASLPSSGSDWLATCLSTSQPSLRYVREFFNATINWRYAERLEQDLGDLMYSTVPHLCRPRSAAQINSLLDDTWRCENYSFTKENYLPWQLTKFAETFDVIVLLRRFEGTFPPRRHRVCRWYEHFHGALDFAGLLSPKLTKYSQTPMNRAAIGHHFFTQKLLSVAHEINAPVLWFHELMDGGISTRLPVENQSALEHTINRTKQRVPRPEAYREQWQEAIALSQMLNQTL